MSSNGLSPIIQEALAASSANDSQRCIALLQQAIQTDVQPAMAQFLLGSELASLGQMDLAEASFAAALLLAPGFDIVRYQLGLLQFSSGRVPQAFVTWQPLLQLPKSNYLHAFVLGFAALAVDNFINALESFMLGMQANTDNLPMNSDIQKIIDKINELQPASGSADKIVRDDSPLREDDSHVLLSNYTQNLNG